MRVAGKLDWKGLMICTVFPVCTKYSRMCEIWGSHSCADDSKSLGQSVPTLNNINCLCIQDKEIQPLCQDWVTLMIKPLQSLKPVFTSWHSVNIPEYTKLNAHIIFKDGCIVSRLDDWWDFKEARVRIIFLHENSRRMSESFSSLPEKILVYQSKWSK
jgi:hypothetical protein